MIGKFCFLALFCELHYMPRLESHKLLVNSGLGLFLQFFEINVKVQEPAGIGMLWAGLFLRHTFLQ